MATAIYFVMRELHMSFKDIMELYTPQFYYLFESIVKDTEEKNKIYKKNNLKH